MVDRIDLVGTKVTAKVVDRWVHKDRSHRFTIMFADGQRRFKVPRDELIVQEHKYFYWNCLTAQTCWEPPDENRKVLWNMFRGRKARRCGLGVFIDLELARAFPRRKLHEAELKRLAELEEERRHRLGQGKDVSDLELIIADRSLDTGGDVKTLALEGQPLLTQNGEVAEGAIVPHQDLKVEAVNEDPVRPVWKSHTRRAHSHMLATQVKAFHEYFRPHYNESRITWSGPRLWRGLGPARRR